MSNILKLVLYEIKQESFDFFKEINKIDTLEKLAFKEK